MKAESKIRELEEMANRNSQVTTLPVSTCANKEIQELTKVCVYVENTAYLNLLSAVFK